MENLPHPGKGPNKWKLGQCILKVDEIPKYEIRSKHIGNYVYYIKDHSIIGKFLGIFPTERDLVAWIHARWKPQGHMDLRLGSKGYFTTIFHCQ
jgi:hypothetical protein